MATQAESQPKAVWQIDPGHSSVEFAVRHMLVSTVKGGFSKFEADVVFDEAHPERSHVEARIDVSSVDTKEANRDTHLRSPDFFDVAKHPWLTFVSKRVEPRGEDRYNLVGDLTIHGITREVVLDTEFAGLAKDPWGGQRAGFTASATVNRKDFGLLWNVALEAGGFLVGDAIKITIEAELVKRNA